MLSFIRLGLIDPRLMTLARNLRQSRRTYLSYSRLYSLADNLINLYRHSPQPINVAEFGVGRGGSATLLAWLINKYRGKITLYDVFGRIPAPSENDGEQALDRYDNISNDEGKEYYGNIDNLLELILKEIHEVCHADRVEIVQGKYEDTLPNLNDNRKFDLVHIDCDWYESSRAVYNYLQSRLKPGAIIQVDDYSNWEGSRRAYQDTEWLSGYCTHLIDGALVIDTSKLTN
jgi:asparagine synthase (glutamine-hydrolysing)